MRQGPSPREARIVDDRCIITVDIGTSSLRSVLFDARGRILRIEQRDNPPRCLDGQRIEQEPGTWERHLIETLSACADEARGRGLVTVALSLTAQRSSVIPVDENGAPLHPAIMWQDTRTRDICSRMEERQAAVFQKTGLRIYPVFSAVKMTWFRENRPDVYEAACKMLGVQDYVIRALTGEFVTDRSLASRTNLFNLRTLDWDDDLLGLFGVDRGKLCRLVDPGSAAGSLRASIAEETGLPKGIPVITAGGDQQCAALGLGLVGPGRMIANTGTGSFLIAGVDRPIIDPGMAVSCNVAAVPGSYILEAASPTSGSIFRWFNKEFFRDAPGGENDFLAIGAEAASSPPGANGVVLLPHFKGRGAPRWDPRAKGAFLGLTPGVTRGDMARAILEGLAAELGENLEAIESLGGRADLIAVAGGMTASDLYNQIQADHYGKRVDRPGVTEATALGAWMSGAVTMGLFDSYAGAFESASEGQPTRSYDPDARTAAIYRRSSVWRRRAYEALRECDCQTDAMEES